MRIKYAPGTIQQCPECHHTSVYFFHDAIMCIVCGWERNRSEGPRPCGHTGLDVVEQPQLPKMRQPSKRARQRARKAAVAKKAAKG